MPLLSHAEDATEGQRRPIDERFVLLCVVLLSASYALWHLDRGWIPHDEGALGQSAMRVLQGELPHRDFIEIYTGGLAYLNAAAFRVLGSTLWTLRVVLFVAFLVWVPAVYWIALRFVKPVAAAGVTLLAVVWTLPTYPEPLPSWYNLFLATIGVAALFRSLEREHARYLAVAGVVGGLSCLIKIVGLYYVSAVLLFLVFRAQTLTAQRDTGGDARALGYALFVTAALAMFVAALVLLVRRQLHLSEVTHFVVPGVMISALLVRNEWTPGDGDSRARFRVLVSLLLPFLAGVLLPVALFLVPYVRAGAVGALIDGVFMLPTKRFAFATIPTMPVTWMLTLLPVVVLIALGVFARGRYRRAETVIVALALLLFFVLTGVHPPSYRIAWRAAFNVMPVLVATGVLILAHARDADARDSLLRQRTMLLLSVTALCSIVQFPFSVPIYLCYVAPLIVLTALALTRYLPAATSQVPALVLGFYLAFALFRTNRSEMITFGDAFRPYGPIAPLLRAHGGLNVQADDALLYNRVVAQLHQRARGEYTWAGPDAPEIYFLSGLRNPTRSLFDFFEDSTNGDARLLASLDAHGVTAIVLNAQPTFSPPITRERFSQLATRFPHARNFGRIQLRWRE